MLKPPYRSPLNNSWYTQSLFYEMARVQTDLEEPLKNCVFTLDQPRDGYICGRTTFVECGDPTGYKWAMKYLLDWDHWNRLIQAKWFNEAVERWRAELKIKMISDAVERIAIIAASDDKQALVANKYLAERPWERATAGRGRPSKEMVQGELKRATALLQEEEDDAERIGLRIVK